MGIPSTAEILLGSSWLAAAADAAAGAAHCLHEMIWRCTCFYLLHQNGGSLQAAGYSNIDRYAF